MAGVSSTISFQNTGATANKVVVFVNFLEHSFVEDLSLSLRAGGVNRSLATRVGGAGDDFVGTIFDDACTTPIASGTAPFVGCFTPQQSLAPFAGQSIDVAPCSLESRTAYLPPSAAPDSGQRPDPVREHVHISLYDPHDASTAHQLLQRSTPLTVRTSSLVPLLTVMLSLKSGVMSLMFQLSCASTSSSTETVTSSVASS